MMDPLLLCCAEMAEVETAHASKRDQYTTQRKDLQIIMMLQHEEKKKKLGQLIRSLFLRQEKKNIHCSVSADCF